MGIFIWTVVGIVILGYIVEFVAKFRKMAKDGDELKQEVGNTDESVFEEDADIEDPLYNMDAECRMDAEPMAQTLKPKKVYVAPIMEVRDESRFEEIRFDLRQAVISQAILQNDYIDNRN